MHLTCIIVVKGNIYLCHTLKSHIRSFWPTQKKFFLIINIHLGVFKVVSELFQFLFLDIKLSSSIVGLLRRHELSLQHLPVPIFHTNICTIL
jgi:hypothetical protein